MTSTPPTLISRNHYARFRPSSRQHGTTTQSTDMLSQSSAQALARLRAYKPPPTQWYNCPLTRRAAVLILLFPDRDGELKVVLTIRASTLRSYAGQAALPGGKADSLTETPFETARREASEEIGLPLRDPPGFTIEHICEMPANLAKTNLGVRPCIAFLSPTSSTLASVEEKMIPRLDPKEVAAVFTAPFKQFLKKDWVSGGEGPKNAKGEKHSWYRGSWTDWHEGRWRMHNFYIPRPPTSSSQLQTKPSSTSSTSSSTSSSSGPKPKISHPSPSPTPPSRYPEGDDPAPEPTPLDDLPTFRVFGMTARILVDAAREAYGEEPEFEHNSHFGDEEMIARMLRMGLMPEKKRKGEELTKEIMQSVKKEGEKSRM
ncbi:hypothetical protein M011DRAFT_464636 [Sporormia fimetaria CBS 119925]|uniref:Nudix hydrolase domain-containing protein n=1 Tax=Sporormia fimetaria CBS 119925 TaxID=1340428 RepID=A0A6A6VM03_9PLEO|nr:hypothetical protein M011DRAFT_464636 [Sporormia fimetaria CBS 119925]